MEILVPAPSENEAAFLILWHYFCNDINNVLLIAEIEAKTDQNNNATCWNTEFVLFNVLLLSCEETS